MSFGNMKKALSTNASMDKKSTIVVNSVMRSYRIDMDIAEALVAADINKNKFVNTVLRTALEEKGML